MSGFSDEDLRSQDYFSRSSVFQGALGSGTRSHGVPGQQAGVHRDVVLPEEVPEVCPFGSSSAMCRY